MTGGGLDADLLQHALGRNGLQAERKDGGNHGTTATEPTTPPSAAQTVADAT